MPVAKIYKQTANDLSAEFQTTILRFVRLSVCCLVISLIAVRRLFGMEPRPHASMLKRDQQRAKWRKEYAHRSTGHLFWECEDDTLVQWHNEMETQRSRSASSALCRRDKLLPSIPIVKVAPAKFFCKKCPAKYVYVIAYTKHQAMHGSNKKFKCDFCDYAADTKRSTTEHMLEWHHNTAPTIDFTGEDNAHAAPTATTSSSSATTSTTAERRSDANSFRVCAENAFGRSNPLNTDVDRPGLPEGPITYPATTNKCQVYVVEDPRDTFVVPEQLRNETAAIEALRRANAEHELRPNDEHETESSDVDEDEYVVESDDDIPAVEVRCADERLLAKAPLNVPGPPGPPKPLHTAYNSITLQWAQPLRDGGTPIVGYELEKREHGTNAQWEKAAFGSVPDTRFKVTGVKQYHFYEFRVAAVNAVGQGEWSDNSVPIAATRSSCKPLITMGMLAREKDLGSDSVDLRLEVVDRPAPPEGSLKVLPELVVSKYQVPSQPDKPVVRDFGRTWAELEWELPASNGGAKIRGYELQHKEKHSEWITCKKSGTWSTTFKVHNLSDRGEYMFRVAARNEAGLSKPSLPSDRIKLPGPPGMPIQVEAQSIGPNCVTLTWQPPAEDGGSKLEGYLVQKREWGHEQWEKATPDMCPLTECLVSGLREFQAYVFRVIAVNLHGCSTPSLQTLPINIVETAGACPTIVINKEVSVQGPSVVPLKSQRANEKEKDATQTRTPKTAQPSSAHGIGPSLDSSDQPLSSTARRCQPRRSARKDATDIQCENLTPSRPKNTERTASGSGRRRVGSTAAARQAQAAAAACAAGEEAPNEEGRQDVAVVTKKNAILAKLKKRGDTSIRALKRRSVRPAEPSTDFQKEFDELRELCDQKAVGTWDDFENSAGFDFTEWTKIGEGAFGEIFKEPRDGACIVLKFIPFAANKDHCSKLVNGDHLKSAKFVFNELFTAKELTKLSEDTGNGFVTPSFTQLRMSQIVRGCFPSKLLTAWDAFKTAKPELAENDRPDTYDDERLHFLVIGLSYGGKDLEKFQIKNGGVCYSIFLQIAYTLAIAEHVLAFEHRDMHAGNLLVEQCPPDEKIWYKCQGKQIAVRSNGVRASIIDFSLSRLEKKGVRFFVDLSQDPGLFEQDGVNDGGDYQYDVYRMMKAISNNNWASFWPQTNVYWTGYAAKKLFNNRFIKGKKKEAIEKLFRKFENFLTIRDLIDDADFLGKKESKQAD
ncbi:hypothetical protein niasHS_018227 [Heterodera schachtii]|uniref:non-specific serine/threonine protein kinase n=1 Tax=Heterodera schachtii TaxID=97005 RepID=A0ABD2HQA9_HETSC